MSANKKLNKCINQQKHDEKKIEKIEKIHKYKKTVNKDTIVLEF